MCKNLRFIFSIFFLVFFNNIGSSQSTTYINLKNVSVLKDQGHVRITWEHDGNDTLYVFSNVGISNSTEEIAIIPDPYITYYIDYKANAHERPRAYRIFNNTAIFSDIVSTYHLTYDYDSCLQQIKLNWASFPTNEWSPTLFLINIIENGVLQAKIPVPATKKEYVVEDLLDNADYVIFIETKWGVSDTDPDTTSNSNPIKLYTEMPIRPDYINAVSTVIDGKNTNIKFNIDPITELDTYKFLKSDSQTGDFDTLETYTTTESQLIASDINSSPNSEVNYYKLVSLNQCGNITDSSNVINNIVLETEIEDFDVSLNWNKFNENTIISEDYAIYRIVNNLEPELIGSFSNFNSFNDNIESLQNYSQFCYFIRATESGAFASNFSQSNIACVYLKPKVYIPEAFTPSAARNNLFQAIFSFVPKEFDFMVYNRWGNIVFETNDYLEAWDGKTSNGNYAPTGAYIYHIRIKSPNDQVVERRGSILVIHP